MTRVRGTCTNCGNPVYYSKAVLCMACHKAIKAARAEANKEQTQENIKASRRNWYYNNKSHAQQMHKQWLDKNSDKVKQYNRTHTVERRAYVESRRARLLEADDGSVTASVWMMILEIYEHQCAYCMDTFSFLEQDHVIPLSRGGKHTIANVVPACMPCNRAKGTEMIEPVHPLYEFIVAEFSSASRGVYA